MVLAYANSIPCGLSHVSHPICGEGYTNKLTNLVSPPDKVETESSADIRGASKPLDNFSWQILKSYQFLKAQQAQASNPGMVGSTAPCPGGSNPKGSVFAIPAKELAGPVLFSGINSPQHVPSTTPKVRPHGSSSTKSIFFESSNKPGGSSVPSDTAKQLFDIRNIPNLPSADMPQTQQSESLFPFGVGDFRSFTFGSSGDLSRQYETAGKAGSKPISFGSIDSSQLPERPEAIPPLFRFGLT
jgi:hypothetical protein